MARSLSEDLRQRVVDAVEKGMTRRGAAVRFGVGTSTAIRWVRQWRETGDVRARARGGDNRSHRIETHGEEIVALIESRPDMTLAEIVAHLEQVHGLRVAQSTVWRFFERHAITVKKNRARQRTRAA
ncbi:MAG: transposase [bacterium]|nr:transposase [bacterium]